MTPEDGTTPTWTQATQARVDTFERQVVACAAQLKGGHPDEVAVAFIQATGSLIRQRVLADPTRLHFFTACLRQLVDHVLPTTTTADADSTTTIRH